MSEAAGHLSRKIMVVGSGASIASMAVYCPLRNDTTSAGGLTILSYDAFTSFDVRSLPSWNFTPRRSLKVYVRPSLAIVQDSARSPTTFVPVRSVGSKRSKVL